MADITKLAALAELNPWWGSGEVPSGLLGTSRPALLAEIKNASAKEEIAIVTGIRRAGKTTLLYQTIRHLLEEKVPPRNILLINCDDTALKDSFSGISDIVSTFNASADGKKFVFLDEVQYYADFAQQLKNAFDTHRKNVKLFVSGSTALLKGKDVYFLTGRFLPIQVHPFSFAEFISVKGVGLPKAKNAKEKMQKWVPLDLDRHLQQYLAFGGFPQVVLEERPEEKMRTAKLYLETILYKDILKLWEVKDVAALEGIARFALQHLGQRFSYRKIAQALQTNLNTTQNYIGYLSNSFLVYFVEHYSASSAARTKKEKKVFAADNALHTAFYGFKDAGLLAENLVFAHLLRKNVKISYWVKKTEVDFVAEENGKPPQPIEVKYQKTINKEDFRGLESFLEEYATAREGILVTRSDYGAIKTREGKTIRMVPLWLYLLE